jgi:hypothetical protein
MDGPLRGLDVEILHSWVSGNGVTHYLVMQHYEGPREIVREIRELSANPVAPFKRPRPSQSGYSQLSVVSR